MKFIVSRDVLDSHTYLRSAYAKILDELKLPIEGYSFSPFGTRIIAHEISQLTRFLFELSPRAAFEEVLKLRESENAIKLRKKWQERLWERSITSSIGLSSTQLITDTRVQGDVNLIMNTYIQASPAHEAFNYLDLQDKEPIDMPKGNQQIEDVIVGGKASQQSDNPTTEQTIRSARVEEDLEQKIASEQPTLKVFGGSASGKIAVVCLVLVIVAWLLYKFLSK